MSSSSRRWFRLFIGGTLTATSIGITSACPWRPEERKSSPEAQIVLGAAVIDDVLGVVLLSLLYEFSTGGGSQPGQRQHSPSFYRNLLSGCACSGEICLAAD